MAEDHLVAVGKKLKATRKRRGITQELLAEASGLSVNTIKRAERGEICPKSLNKLARVLGLNVVINLGEAE